MLDILYIYEHGSTETGYITTYQPNIMCIVHALGFEIISIITIGTEKPEGTHIPPFLPPEITCRTDANRMLLNLTQSYDY